MPNTPNKSYRKSFIFSFHIKDTQRKKNLSNYYDVHCNVLLHKILLFSPITNILFFFHVLHNFLCANIYSRFLVGDPNIFCDRFSFASAYSCWHGSSRVHTLNSGRANTDLIHLCISSIHRNLSESTR